jgi:preprotein translocase subunit SecG
MLQIIQTIIGLLIILLVVPQTPTENVVLRKFLDTGLFTNYSEAKYFLKISTWILICSFLALTFLLNIV